MRTRDLFIARKFRISLYISILFIFINACTTITSVANSPLYANGPWLALIDDNNKAYVVNNDGTGLTSLAPELLTKRVLSSPTSNRIAILNYLEEDVLSYKLSLIELPKTNIYKSISLFSFFDSQPEKIDNSSTGSLNAMLGNIQWSPDSRYLAFTGAIESSSSALYIYDVNQDTIKQISQTHFQTVNPLWSPDGKWIIYEEVSDFHGWQTEGIWAVSPQSSKLKLLYKPTNRIQQKVLGWVDNNNFVVADRGIDAERNIRMVNIQTGDIKTLYSGYYLGATLDTKKGSIAFFPFPGAPGAGSNLESGIYLVSPEINELKLIIPSEKPIFIHWNSETQIFESEIICTSNSEDIIVFNSMGETSCAPKQKPNASPNMSWYITLNEKINIYKSSGVKAGEISKDVSNIIWRPDSNGFFFVDDTSLFYASLPELNYIEVYNSSNFFSFAWVGIH